MHGEEPEDVDIGSWEELGEEGQAGREEEPGNAQETCRNLAEGSEEGLESPVEEEKAHLESGRRTAMGDMERLSRQTSVSLLEAQAAASVAVEADSALAASALARFRAFFAFRFAALVLTGAKFVSVA